MKVSAAAYGNVLLQECKNTEFVWELKQGFKQGDRKWSCLLMRVSIKRASTVVCEVYTFYNTCGKWKEFELKILLDWWLKNPN